MNKEALQQQIVSLRSKLDAIESGERETENARHVGKHFKYRNCYSCPKGPQDYWWMYVKVLEADGYELKTFEFQTDKDGRIEIKPDATVFRRMSDGYQPCTAAEFRKAWAIVQRKVKSLP